jgi:hypothetical protein
MTEEEIMKLSAVKITWFGPKVLEKTMGVKKAKTATAAMSMLSCNSFARAVKTANPDAADYVDSFYCPNNDSVVVRYQGKFFDADIHPEDRTGGLDGNVRVVFYVNEDESTQACYRELFSLIKKSQIKNDPTKVGMFEQKASQEFKN